MANVEEHSTTTGASFPSAGEAEAKDSSIYEHLLQPWELCNIPTERGDFGYHMRYLTMPGITLYREQYDLRCRLQGLSPAKVVALLVPLRLGPHSNFWRAPADDSDFPAMLPGGLDVQMDTGQDHLILLLDLPLLAEYLSPEHYQALQHLANDHRIPSGPARIERFGKWLLELLDITFHKPDMLKYPAVILSMQEDLLNRLMEVTQFPSVSTRKSHLSRRSLGLDRALEFLREVDISSISIPEISEVAGVSLRTLEYAFQDAFELSPLSYLRLQRMHTARRALLAANLVDTTVTAVACKNGFYQPAKFAIDYRRLFDESPSKTLRQQHQLMENELSPLIC